MKGRSFQADREAQRVSEGRAGICESDENGGYSETRIPCWTALSLPEGEMDYNAYAYALLSSACVVSLQWIEAPDTSAFARRSSLLPSLCVCPWGPVEGVLSVRTVKRGGREQKQVLRHERFWDGRFLNSSCFES